MKDINSLAYTKWICKYHIAFALKYRRKDFYGGFKIPKECQNQTIFYKILNWYK